MAEATGALARDRPLPAFEFSNVIITGNGAQAVIRSGVKVYTKFPLYEGTDLEKVCPGTLANLEIRDLPQSYKKMKGMMTLKDMPLDSFLSLVPCLWEL